MPNKPPAKRQLKLSDLGRLRPESQHRAQIQEELTKESDRSAALLAVAQLDQTLEDALRQRFENLTPQQDHEIFGGTAPLATFAAKIRFGYAMGLYGEITSKDLLTISHIRNAFAHAAISVSFATDEIAASCRSMCCLEEYPKHGFSGLGSEFSMDGAAPKAVFIATIYDIAGALSRISADHAKRQLKEFEKLIAPFDSGKVSAPDFNSFLSRLAHGRILP